LGFFLVASRLALHQPEEAVVLGAVQVEGKNVQTLAVFTAASVVYDPGVAGSLDDHGGEDVPHEGVLSGGGQQIGDLVAPAVRALWFRRLIRPGRACKLLGSLGLHGGMSARAKRKRFA
jgi:hypothetical protein